MARGTAGRRTGARALRTLGALLALAVLLVGVPWALLTIGNAADLLRLDWYTTLVVHADSRLWLALLSVAGWAAWLVLTATVVLEVVAVVSRQRIHLTLPGTGWLRPAVAALVLAVAAPSVAAAAPTEAPSPVPSAPAPPSPDQTPSPGDRSTRTRTYTVVAGDELWSIAERELGAGVRWREIVALNGLAGSRIDPGMVLRLPELEPPGTIEVEVGDTLWSIAGEELDNPRRWPEIGALNKDVLPDPDVLTEGLRIKLPPDAHSRQREAGSPAPPEEQETPAKDPSEEPPEPAEASKEPGGAATEPSEAPPLPATPSQETRQPSQAPVPVAEPAGEGVEDAPVSASVGSPASLWVASLGAVLAAGVVTTLVARRRAQLLSRPVGRRVPTLGTGPAPFLAGLAQAAVTAPPRPRHTLLGWTPDDRPVTVDLERARMTVFLGRDALGALGAVVTGLLCGDDSTHVVLPGGHDWAAAIDEPRVASTADNASGLADLTRLCAERRLALRGASLAQMRSDPDRAEHWQPVVFVFQRHLSPPQAAAVAEAMALGDVGVSAVFAAPTAPPSAAVVRLGDQLAEFEGCRFIPQRLPEPARRALIELLSGTGRLDTEPAPWWQPALPSNVRPLPRPADHHRPEEAPVMTPWPCPPHHPRLLLLGDVEVLGAAGPKPTRARLQCLEYCAWLLEHPGATPTAMLQDLLVAETTRRSNMSRLRTWLGQAPDGARYLPDAYSGRIDLDPRVESDWDRFRALLAGGVNVAPTAALAEALSLVRGAPLGPNWFQWAWAEQLRCDMIAMIVDVACELADRAIKLNSPDQALWAIAQGRKVGEEFDVIAVREIHALALAGRTEETRSAVLRLSRVTRGAGRDLAPDLARRVQFALRLVAPPAPAAPPASPMRPSAPGEIVGAERPQGRLGGMR